MQLGKLDHVNLRTANLDVMVDWYARVLGMQAGERPSFPFPGAWLYADGHPAVHLVGVDRQPQGEDLRLEHFAFSATGLAELLRRLDSMGIEYRLARVPDIGVLQVNVFDPDGNHIHIDFAGEETEGHP